MAGDAVVFHCIPCLLLFSRWANPSPGHSSENLDEIFTFFFTEFLTLSTSMIVKWQVLFHGYSISLKNNRKRKEGHKIMREIYGIIRKLGVTSNYKGYFFLADAIRLAMNSQGRPILITKEIYPYLAAKYKTTTMNIEHNIRTVVNICWITNRKEMIQIAGYPLICKPTNSEFIDMAAYYLMYAQEEVS